MVELMEEPEDRTIEALTIIAREYDLRDRMALLARLHQAGQEVAFQRAALVEVAEALAALLVEAKPPASRLYRP